MAKDKADGMGGKAFNPHDHRFNGPKMSVHSPVGSTFDTFPVVKGEDEACQQINRQGKTGIKGA